MAPPSNEKLVQLGNDLLEQFDILFGLHPGFRPASAKGVVLTGSFPPSSKAASLASTASHAILLGKEHSHDLFAFRGIEVYAVAATTEQPSAFTWAPEVIGGLTSAATPNYGCTAGRVDGSAVLIHLGWPNPPALFPVPPLGFGVMS